MDRAGSDLLRNPGLSEGSFRSCRLLPIFGLLVLFALSSTSAFASPPSNAFRFFHDSDGRLKAAIDPEGDTAVYSWDAAGNLLSVSRHASSKLSIVQLNPAHGEVGATVTIEGTGFSTTPASNTVKFNGTAASVSAASATALTVKVPGGATTGSLTVTVGEEGPVTSPEIFNVGESAPKISSISPTLAVAGEEVTVSGSNFEADPYEDALTLNGAHSELVSTSTSSIKFTVPPGRLGGSVAVTTPAGTATGPDLFIPPSGTATSKVGTTGRFSLGASKTVEFAGSEKVALMLFDATAGRRASLSLSESTITSGSVSIWSPSGTQLVTGSFSKSSGGFIETPVLPSAGSYTVLLSPSGSSAGSVKLTSYEFEDLTGSITPVASAEGSTQHVSLTVPGQNARYSVTMSAGEKVAVRTNSAKMTGSYKLRWLNSKGEALDTLSLGKEENWFWDTHTFATAGTYTLEVDPEGTATGSVDLQAWEDPDLTGQTITPSEAGGSATSTINIPGQRELITFAGTKEGRIAWAPSESTISAGGTITLLRPNGAALNSGSFTSGFHEPVTLPETGTYTFLVDPEGTRTNPVTNGTGKVKITAYAVPADLTGSITPVASAEGSTQHVSLTVPGQNARYSVTMSAGEKVAVRTNSAKMTGSYKLRWLNSKGEALDTLSLGKEENWFWDTHTFATAGTYTLEVDPEGTATGSVDLQAWEDPDLTGQTITPSEAGGSATSTINIPGQRELITFAGTASQLVTVKAQESTIASGTFWVLKPDGTKLSGSEATFTSSSSGRRELTLPSTGTYTIVIDPPGTATGPIANGTGSVKVLVYLGSHVAWFSPIQPSAELVSLTSPSPHEPSGYSDALGRAQTPRASHAPEHFRDHKKAHRRTPPMVSNARVKDRSAEPGEITPAMRKFEPGPVNTWHPPRHVPGWESAEPKSPWATISDLQAPAGTTALAGQVLQRNGLPVAGVRVSIEGTSADTETDEAGRFLLSGLPAGRQTLIVNGETVPGDQRYGSYEVAVELQDHKTTDLDYTVWLSPLDPAGNRTIASPTPKETDLTTPSIPGLEVRIPAGTVIKNAAGKTVKDLNITPIPVNQAPFPLPPFVPIPVYFTIQPGRAYLSKGAQIVYPNWGDLRPGQRAEFWNYDPKDRGWYVYGRGTVSADGKQVVPDPGVRVWQFTGAMLASGPLPSETEPTGSESGDPVDLYSGLFVYHKRDLTLPDTIPIDIQRTYRPADSNSYSFGIGTTNQYDMRLWSGAGAAEANLIMPDGQRIHYARTSPGTGFVDGEYKSTSTPGPFYASTLKYHSNGAGAYWDLKLTNGMTYVFGTARLLEVRDPHGNKLVITRSGEDITQITSPHGRWAKFSYDESHRITEITDNGGRHIKYSYTSGRLSKVEGLAGRTTEYEYDGSGRMKAVIDARGNKYLQVAYDANGRVEKQTAAGGATFNFAYALNESGKVEATTVIDPLGNQRKVQFNGEGRQISETEAPGTELARTTNLELQPETGLILSETDPLGHKTAFEYDSSGNVTEVTKLAGTEEAATTKYKYAPGTSHLTELTDPLNHTTKFEYGPNGELLKKTDALSHETTVKYDGEGQPISVTNAEGEETKLGYSSGDLTSITDPLGRTTTRFVDSLGRLTALRSPGGQLTRLTYNSADQVTGVELPSGAETAVEYDADGNPIAVTDPRGHKTTFSYDVMDRLVKETDPLEHAAEWSYDKAGDVTEVVDRNGKVSTFSYDALRRMTLARYGVSGLEAESSIGYEYDLDNRLAHVSDSASGEYAIKRDPFGRIESLEGPGGTVGYSYDAAGRREAMTLPGLEPLHYSYDNANELTELSRGSESVGLEYDKAGRTKGITLPDGIKQEYGYDAAGQNTSITYKHSGSTLGAINYAYDANGQLEAMWGSYARLNLPEALNTTEYNADNELVKREGAELGYDKEGNLLSEGANEYSWNARGQMTGISGGASASFGYDPFGRRISKTLGGTTTELLYDEANVALESEEGTTTASLLSGLRPDQLFARTTGSGTDSYLTDRLGSTIALANASAELTTTYSYEPFGASTTAGAESDNPYQFTGRENDGTGLQYNRARYYSFGEGRFISQDPAGFAGSGTDLYGYAFGDPVGFIDPTGECIVVCLPNPISTVEHGLSAVANQVGDWVSDAEAVLSEDYDFYSSHTFGFCIGASAGAGIGINVQMCLAGNLQNAGLTATAGAGGYLPFGAGVEGGPLYSNASRNSQLGGRFTYGAASVRPIAGPTVGVNTASGNSGSKNINTISPTVGISVGPPVSVQGGISWTETAGIEW
jgi:RHS repeat-associated protein